MGDAFQIRMADPGGLCIFFLTVFDIHRYIIHQPRVNQFPHQCRAGSVRIQFDRIPQFFDLCQQSGQSRIQRRFPSGHTDTVQDSFSLSEHFQNFLRLDQRLTLRCQHQTGIVTERAPEITGTEKNGGCQPSRVIQQRQFVKSVYLRHMLPYEAKNVSISFLDACTEPCTKNGFPPPRPCNFRFISFTNSRRSPSFSPMI